MTPPPGWTMDPKELNYEGEWAAEDSWGYNLAVDFELGKCTPIMCRTDYGGGEVLFEAGGKFYLYDELGLHLRQITSPTTLDDIIALFKGDKKAKNSLKCKAISS